MTADIINLRRARKQRARAADKADAAANAARHGVGKAERALADAEAERLRRTLDGARVGTEGSDDG
ncbi:MAG: DUF4169 domain-containing protein [Rhodobacterales bacterium CG_4_10_14_0_8_um_filter_70_9]|nr:MAG: DUF4169 domain-containing protein [Rhodobacterales bacterium CG_4_10_14_0_8_um_filter_70_9]PJA59333.1 MAG: DUF4169 domain-containing protein [Rhodobacterales bacterium CG_4_9_14_3_um_filter_71_31]